MKTTNRLYVFSIIAFGCIIMASCNSNTTGTEDETSIEGTWKCTTEIAVDYLHIDLPNAAGYETSGDCYFTDSFTLEHLSEDKYLATDNSSQNQDALSLRIQNNRLITEVGGEVLIFERSDADVSTFEICGG